jgi:PTS system ascorbate-specific IIA component
MAALLIIAHAPLATSLRAVAQHTYPDCAATLQALDVMPSDSPDDVEAQLRRMLPNDPASETLILADVFGATPCNAALRVADGNRVRVVAGANVPMLWRVLCYAAEPLEQLVARAVSGAMQGVMQVSVSRPQNQTAKTGNDDQVHHQHQQ